ncbi:MAG: hypothetical protein Q8891_17680 [Bacteroidota bacterium]|nr:hypothetical protein [Bacteroidota bacterium]
MEFKIIKKLNQKISPIITLGATWLIVQSFLIWHNGIVTAFEAEKYITEAQYFLQYGKFTSNNFWLYSTQIFLIAIVLKIHLGYVVIVAIQLLLNLLAAWMFYQLAFYYLKNSLLAFWATFIYLINITYQFYNSYLFTESIFYSLTIIYSSYLLRIKKLNTRNIIILFLSLIILSITRPTGILFFGGTAVYIFFRFLQHLSFRKKAIIIISAVIIFLVTINTMLETGGSLDFMQPFKQENIICGVNTFHNADIQTLEKGNSLEGLIYYIIHNKDQFLRLARLKTIAFFGFVRNYYSPLHNAYLIIFFYPFYILCIPGFIKMYKAKDKATIYLLFIILLYWVTTLLTCDDWHNRFVLTISPFIFLIGLAAFKSKNSVP